MILKSATKQNLLEPCLRFVRAQAHLRLELREAGNSDVNDLKRKRKVAIMIACDLLCHPLAPCHSLSDLQESEKSKEEKGDLWHQPTTVAFNHNFLGEFKRLGSWFVWAAICLGRHGMDWNGTRDWAHLERQACWSMPSTNAEVQRFWWTLECNILRTMWMWYNLFIYLFNREGAKDLNARSKQS